MFSLTPPSSFPATRCRRYFVRSAERSHVPCLYSREKYYFANSPPINDYVETGLVLVKPPEATRTAAEDDGHAVDHGLVEVAETEARLLLSVKFGKQVEAFAERVDYYIISIK